MADPRKRLVDNIPGDFFVDSTCIDCDTCRQLAPGSFAEGAGHAMVWRQPETDQEYRQAHQALLCCPTGSIGTAKPVPRERLDDFPLYLAEDVFYCGFNSKKSYGGNSYFLRHPQGNWLVDSPKFLSKLVDRLSAMGGVANIFLTHSDDVADAALYARHFGATRYIHRHELHTQPDAEVILEGLEPTPLAANLLALPTPGHTAGHMVLLYRQEFLFTGDHLAWDREQQRLTAFRDYCWHSWDQQKISMHRLSQHHFSWVLPGHGQRVQLPASEMRQQLQQLLARM